MTPCPAGKERWVLPLWAISHGIRQQKKESNASEDNNPWGRTA